MTDPSADQPLPPTSLLQPQQSALTPATVTIAPGPPRPPHTPTNNADEIGGYRIHGILGRGGMGSVLLGEDTRLHRKVAIKLIRPELLSDSGYVDRFLREARLVAQLDHPNIVRIHQVGVEPDGRPYQVLEFVDGVTLSQALSKPEGLPLETVLEYIAQACDGLAAAARAGVIHRDIKPANIMIRPDGVVKVMDFGIARSVGGDGLTSSAIIVGTPDYMSPEQAEGLPVDWRTDVYALGITLFQMVTGYLPFRASSAVKTLIKQSTEPLPRDERLDTLAQGRLRALIEHMTAKNRDHRPPSYEVVATELRTLRAMLAGGGTVTRQTLPNMPPPSPPPQSYGSGGSLYTPVSGYGAPSAATNATAPPTPQRRAFPPWLIAAICVGVLALALAPVALGVLKDRRPVRAVSYSPGLSSPNSAQSDGIEETYLSEAPSSHSNGPQGAPPPPPPRDDANASITVTQDPQEGALLTLKSGGPKPVQDLLDQLRAAARIAFETDAAFFLGGDHGASWSLKNRKPAEIFHLLAAATGRQAQRSDRGFQFLTTSLGPREAILASRERVDVSKLPRWAIETQGRNLSLQEWVEENAEKSGMDYIIVTELLSRHRIPPATTGPMEFPQLFETLKGFHVPVEWTVIDNTLILYPAAPPEGSNGRPGPPPPRFGGPRRPGGPMSRP